MTCAGSVRSAARFLETLGYPTGTPVPFENALGRSGNG
jgi:hypothetical protein